MIAEIPNYTPYFLEGSEWIQVLVFGWFIYTKLRRWLQLRTISLGHNYLGLVVLVVLTIGLILMMMGQQHITLLRVIIYGGLGIEQVFRHSYHNKLDIPEQYLHPVERPAVEHIPLLTVPYRKLFDYLSNEPDSSVFWSSASYRNAALGVMFALLAAFGFSRSINNYTEGVKWAMDKAVAEQEATVRITQSQVHNAVVTAVASATTAVRQVADTLRRGQDVLSRKIDASAKASAARASSVKAALVKNSKQPSRTILQFNLPAPRQIPRADFRLPTQVKPVPMSRPNRRGVPFSYEDGGYTMPDTLLANYPE